MDVAADLFFGGLPKPRAPSLSRRTNSDQQHTRNVRGRELADMGSSDAGPLRPLEGLWNDRLRFVGIGAFVTAGIDRSCYVVVGSSVLHGAVSVAEARQEPGVEPDVAATAGGAAVNVVAGNRGCAGIPSQRD